MGNIIDNSSMLRVGTILRGVYRIDSYLASGGFGKTYVATNIEFNERVAIKEFFIKDIAMRDANTSVISVTNGENLELFAEQKEKFKKEARRMRQLSNPYIVRVHDLFEENGTAYYVMDYIEGENLSRYLERTGHPMSEAEVRRILPQILDALQTVHNANIWHLDLKPSNIMLDKSGNIKLIDFGASKQLNTQKGGATTGTRISYTPGYAPREQMEQNYDKFGPWTDIYALGATLYNLLTNKRPPMPSDIDDDISEDKHIALPLPSTISAEVQHLIIRTMMTDYKKRTQNIKDVRSYLVMEGQSVFLKVPPVPNQKSVPQVPNLKSLSHISNIDAQATKISASTLHESPKTIIVKSKRYSNSQVPPIVPSPKVSVEKPIRKENSSFMIFIIVCFVMAFGVVFILFFNLNDRDLDSSNPHESNSPISIQQNQTSSPSSIQTNTVTKTEESDLVRLIANKVGKYPYEVGLSDNKEFSRRFSSLIGSRKYSSFRTNNILESPIKKYDNSGKFGVHFFDKDEQYIYYIIYDKPKDNLTVIMMDNGVDVPSFLYAQEKTDQYLIDTFNEDVFNN